jgi:Family of unknown function (DUF6776)
MFAALALIAIVVAGYLSFEFGRIQADFNIVDSINERRAYEAHIEELEDEIVALKQEIELQKTHREVEAESYREIESNLVRLEAKIREQRDAIAFYRGIVSPEDSAKGLRVQDLTVTPGAEDRAFNVRLVLVQVRQNDRRVSGEVELSIEGQQNGTAATYSLAELSPPDADTAWPFGFRYFQDFDRQLILPDGFSPERINVEVRSSTRSVASVTQTFPWQRGQSS